MPIIKFYFNSFKYKKDNYIFFKKLFYKLRINYKCINNHYFYIYNTKSEIIVSNKINFFYLFNLINTLNFNYNYIDFPIQNFYIYKDFFASKQNIYIFIKYYYYNFNFLFFKIFISIFFKYFQTLKFVYFKLRNKMPTLKQICTKSSSKRKPKKKFVIAKKLIKCPQKRGVCIKIYVMKPKKPNSANRKVAKIRLSTGKKIIAYINGAGHNLQPHSIVLVRGGRRRDLPGIHYQLIRGKYDFTGPENFKRTKRRSKFGIKKK